MRRQFCFLILATCLIAACDKISSPFKSDSPLIGGEAVPVESAIAKSTVSIGLYMDGKYVTNCTGAIVSEDIILTAAHCVQGYEIQDMEAVLYFGSDLTNYDITLERTSSRWVMHQGFQTYYEIDKDKNKVPVTRLHDIAILRLDEKIPPNSKPAKLIGVDREIPKASKITLAGWGLTQFEPRVGTDLLRYTEVTLEKYWNTHLITNQMNQKGACAGDSGGPAFALNDAQELVVIGITRGPHLGGWACDTYGEYTSITQNLDMIIDAIDSIQGQAPSFDNSIGQEALESKMNNLIE